MHLVAALSEGVAGHGLPLNALVTPPKAAFIVVLLHHRDYVCVYGIEPNVLTATIITEQPGPATSHFVSKMTSQFLEVPRGRHGGRLPPLMQTAKVEQEIHSRCIGVHELSSLMQRRFPMGGYNINVCNDDRDPFCF